MKEHIKEAVGIVCLVLALSLAGILGAFGRSCQDDIFYGIRGTSNALQGK